MKPIIIEFAGLPNAGKTTLICNLADLLRDQHGLNVVKFKEAAELVPAIIPKKTWDRNTWTTLRALQDLVTAKYIEADVVLLDRSFWDALMWINFMNNHDMCSKEEYNAMKDFICCFQDISPQNLFILDVEVEESIKRRAKQKDLPTPVYSTNSFLTEYQEFMRHFFLKEVAVKQLFFIDTTHVSQDELLESVVKMFFDSV